MRIMEKRVGEDFPRDPPKTILTNGKKKIRKKSITLNLCKSFFFSSSLRNIYEKKQKYFLSFFYFIHPIKHSKINLLTCV